jgi:hypothetical protein
MTLLAPASHAKDRVTLALATTLFALFVGWATDVKGGEYSPLALVLLTIGAILLLAAIVLPPSDGVERFLSRRFIQILAGFAIFSTLVSTGIELYLIRADPEIRIPLLFLAAIGLLLACNPRRMRIPLFLAMVILFCAVSVLTFISPMCDHDPGIDVFLFQQSAVDALHHGQNPYAMRFPNIYSGKYSTVFLNPSRFGPGTPYYGPGVVDDNGWITYGFPYPPLSLLMSMPGYLLGGDCRFALVIALALSALMMGTVGAERWGPLAALLLLINPQGFFVIDMSWTEPLLLLNFSLVMFCAFRWRKGLPWALGLFFATKQYTVLLLPAVFLLLEGPNLWKQFMKITAQAGLVAAAVTVPFFAWNPHEFIRSIVLWQLVQPFRADALSYLVWIYNHDGGQKLPIWIPFLVVIPAIILVLRRCARSPAGFASAVTFISLTFFAFNKQAFCNYYYFVIGAALWSVAALRPRMESRSAALSTEVPAMS